MSLFEMSYLSSHIFTNAMKKTILLLAMMVCSWSVFSQIQMTTELLWQLGRVSAMGITKDGKNVLYRVSTPSMAENKSNTKLFIIPILGGVPQEVSGSEELLKNNNLSPDGKYLISAREVKLKKVFGKDLYPDLDKLTKDEQHRFELLISHWDVMTEKVILGNHIKLRVS